MLNLNGQRPKIQEIHGQHKIVPLEAYGMQVMSIGFIVDPEQAVVLRGPRLAGILQQFISECLWGSLDYLIIDLPPGTGDIQLTLVQSAPVTGVVMVTTPQDVAVADAVKAMNMFQLSSINVPVLGVIENMAWFTPSELPDNKYYIFGQGGGRKLADAGETILLGQIPLVQSIRESGDNGIPIVSNGSGTAAEYIQGITTELVKQVDLRNQNQSPTQIVQVEK
jgi:ATP-binding protein involved in chromosome partitioning